jgi:hypothetical protein
MALRSPVESPNQASIPSTPEAVLKTRLASFKPCQCCNWMIGGGYPFLSPRLTWIMEASRTRMAMSNQAMNKMVYSNLPSSFPHYTFSQPNSSHRTLSSPRRIDFGRYLHQGRHQGRLAQSGKWKRDEPPGPNVSTTLQRASEQRRSNRADDTVLPRRLPRAAMMMQPSRCKSVFSLARRARRCVRCPGRPRLPFPGNPPTTSGRVQHQTQCSGASHF